MNIGSSSRFHPKFETDPPKLLGFGCMIDIGLVHLSLKSWYSAKKMGGYPRLLVYLLQFIIFSLCLEVSPTVLWSFAVPLFGITTMSIGKSSSKNHFGRGDVVTVQCDFQIRQEHPHQVKDVQQGRQHPQNDHSINIPSFHAIQAFFQVLEKIDMFIWRGTMFAATAVVEQEFFPLVNLTPQSCQVNNGSMVHGYWREILRWISWILWWSHVHLCAGFL